jgi:probable phosphoglycerate mutase
MTAVPGHPAGRVELIRLSAEIPLEVAASEFVFVRHGETDGNKHKIFQPAEIPLNESGLEQARRAGHLLREHNVERIVASTMARAWRTAELVGAPKGLSPEPSDLIRERWFGKLVGTSSAEIDWAITPPEGESLVAFIERTRRGVAEALQSGKPTAIVAHGGNLHVVSAGLGVELDPEFSANATPLVFERQGGRWRVTRVGTTGGASGNLA